jgi:NhaA family Na+:H+ antiporter
MATTNTPRTDQLPNAALRGGRRVLFAVVAPLRQFFRTQAASGVVLMVATAAALVWANSSEGALYHRLLALPVEVRVAQWGLAWPLHHWINDALMAVFFLVAGMEIKHALSVGELRTLRQAALPLLGAAGGMLVPALLFLAFNARGEGRNGWGIPMATDIAFALGCLSLIRSRIPRGLFVFLTALAIFDDLGAIIVIALFYGSAIHVPALALAVALSAALIVLGRLGVQRLTPYLVLGVALWGATLASGVHATLAGVILGLALPAQPRREPRDVLSDLDEALDDLRSHPEGADHSTLAAVERHLEAMQSPLARLLGVLEKPVSFVIVPLFALANAGVELGADVGARLRSAVALGVAVGLVIGKTVGVFGTVQLAVRTRLAQPPENATHAQLFGVSIMAGVGFTMSLFVTMLAFAGRGDLVEDAKVGILLGSFVAATVGIVVLRAVSKVVPAEQDADPVALCGPDEDGEAEATP